MKYNSKIVKLFCYLLCATSYVCFAQPITQFNHITVEDGLSQSSVLSITQDKTGFMWFSTLDGINRYDGKYFKVFRLNTNNDPNPILGTLISKIFCDSNDNLFVLTDNGLNFYNEKEEKFITIDPQKSKTKKSSDNIPTCIINNMFNQVLIGTNSGLFFLNLKDKSQFKNAVIQKNPQEEPPPINAIHEDLKGRLWVSSSNGLRLMKRDVDGYYRETNYPKINDIQRKLSLLDIVCFADAPNGELWIGTHFGGLFLFNPTNGTLVSYHDQINSLNIRKILIANDGRIWIGTLNGLFVMNQKTRQAIRYVEDAKLNGSLSNNSIYDVFQDKIGNIWIGTYYGGVNLIYVKTTGFKYRDVTGTASGPSSKIISYLNEVNKGEIFVGTEAAGVDLFKPSTNKFKPFNWTLLRDKVQGNLIKVIHKDREGLLWFGSQDAGLEMYDPKSKIVIRYFNTKKTHSATNPNAIYAILEDSYKRFWVGSQRFGLLNFDKNSGTFKSFVSNKSDFNDHRFIKVIFEDSKRNIWFGTNAGVGLLKKGSTEIICFHKKKELDYPLLSDNINCIIEDSKGAIWFGTKHGGVSIFNNDKFQSFNKLSGLPSDNVYGVLEDVNGVYWLSTDEGLSRFDYPKRQFINYSKTDGLPTNIFNNNSFLKSLSGILYFGSYNGLVSFKPEDIQINDSSTPLVFLGLVQSTRNSSNKSKYQNYDQILNSRNEIKLKYNENTFTIFFSLLNYIKSSKNKYEYKLEGFDKEWLVTDLGLANYANLTNGDYNLLVRGANNDGFWSPVKKIKITILPPFWQSGWAYFFYFIVLISLLGFIVQYLFIRIRLKQEQKIHEMKMNFFMDISHELRTPLTLILGTVDQVLNKASSEIDVKSKLHQVKINAQRLVRLVSELLDFRKAESGNMTLQVAELDLVAFSKLIIDNFQDVLEEKKIKLHFTSSLLSTVNLWFDDVQMEKVLFNLLSNAVKFTPKEGLISFEIDQTENEVIIKITNSGIDIPIASREKIFDNFYQVNLSKSLPVGTGIGLALSRKILDFHHAVITLENNNEGVIDDEKFTRFVIVLRKGKKHFLVHELVAEHKVTYNKKEEDLNIEVNSSITPSAKEKTKYILIAEDNADIRELIKSGLEGIYHVMECENGAEALEMSIDKCPDLIISDVMMPLLDGISFCNKVKTDERTSHIPVVLLTALSDHLHQVSGLQHGADLYMLKPFSMQLLLLNINNILNSRDLLRSKFRKKISFEPANIEVTDVDERFILKVMKLIEDNLVNPDFSVSFLASSLFMNKNSLYKKIEALTNLSVNEFIKSIRIKKAAQLLKNSSLRIGEISFMVGFNDSQYFSREFKKQFGSTPKDFSNTN
jgi:ligand-binding sensor domain-containing protein/CheY-like chemotaxis protein/AraC-like DNA-binding protein